MTNESKQQFSIDILFKAYLAGDREAEKELFEHLTVSFRLFARHKIWDRHDAEDIVQDSLVTIINKCRDIKFETSFAVWAYQVLRYKLMNFVGTKITRKTLMERELGNTDRIDPYHFDPELRTRLVDCFRNISKSNIQHARVLNLRYQGYTSDEICRIMNITRNNMYVILSRARAALELCLKKGDADDG